MKKAVVTVRPGKRVRLPDVDPSNTGGDSKPESLIRIVELREKFVALQQALFAEHTRSLLIIIQAMDTGGKDGAVKQICAGLDPAGVQLTSFKSPTIEELDHDFLWRVHKVTPARGMIGVWNRSHYEDVLIARVHKLVRKEIWQPRFDDINAFERILTNSGVTILKFFLHISKDEQKKRLQSRLDEPDKRWKFNPADLKDRALWNDYQEVYEEAINRCSTEDAPWHIIPANRKWARNLALIEMIVHTLEEMNPRYPKLTFDPKTIVIE